MTAIDTNIDSNGGTSRRTTWTHPDVANRDPQGPVRRLTELRDGDAPWAKRERKLALDKWEYTTTFIGPAAIRDLASLVLDGWGITVLGDSSRIRICINRKATHHD